jgi:hypothetical protein
MLLDALASADSLVEVDPSQLQQGAGRILPEKTLLSWTLSTGGLPTEEGAGAPLPEAGRTETASAEEAGIDSGSDSSEHPECAPASAKPETQPDAQARIAASSPSDLAAAVAEYLLA